MKLEYGNMATKHTVKSYDEDLDLLRSIILEMGREAEDQISKAGKALLNRDGGLADVIIVCDEKVNFLQQEAEELGVRILATRQPMAQDLRNVIAGFKMASELERIADYAANIPDIYPIWIVMLMLISRCAPSLRWRN